MADLVGAQPEAVVLGDSLATLLLRLIALIAQDWRLGDEIVVSRLDNDVVRRPLLAAARAQGAVVRWAEVDLDTGELPEWQYDQLITRRTRFVTVALPLSRRGLLTAVTLGFAHTLGEFGVVLMIGGNIPGRTRVLSIAIYDHVERLEYVQAHLLSGGMLLFSFAVLWTVYSLNRRLARVG